MKRALVTLLALCGLLALGATLRCEPVPPLPLDARTVDVPSAARPAETPGTPGVVVTQPKLLARFPDGVDLNRARYTRWRLNGPEQQPDAILVLVAGFGGGGNNFLLMAEDLIARTLADHGLVLEVWAFHRRSNRLEDRMGARVADFFGEPQVALDWYYGDDLGLSLHPLLAHLGRRAVFFDAADDIAFLANWTPQVHAHDIDAVVEAALAVARNANVFLGGHSAGTGFAARYAATDFDIDGMGPSEPGYAKLRGLVLLEGGGGSSDGPPLTEDSLDRIIAKADGGLFGAVRDQAPRCVDGTTPCTLATEASDCAGQSPPVCTPPTAAYTGLVGGPGLLAASEILALQARTADDPDDVLAIVQQDQSGPGTSAADLVPDLAALGFAPPSTPYALFGTFLDDDGAAATLLSPAVATALGGPGGSVDGLARWNTVDEGPFAPNVVPDNGPAPTTLGGDLRWGQEVEVVRMERFVETFLAAGHNAADWYYGTSGLSVTTAPGVCDAGTSVCAKGNVGAACSDDGDCSQSVSLDSTALSVGRGRPDIANQVRAADIDVPVACFGGTNGLAPVPQRFLAFARSIGACAAPSCDGTPRVVDPDVPSPAFPTYGGVAGGFEVHMSEGYAHNDVLVAEDGPGNRVLGPLADFIARNAQ